MEDLGGDGPPGPLAKLRLLLLAGTQLSHGEAHINGWEEAYEQYHWQRQQQLPYRISAMDSQDELPVSTEPIDTDTMYNSSLHGLNH